MDLIQLGKSFLTKVKNNQFRSISIFMNISLIFTCFYLYNQIKDTHNVVMQKTDELYDIIDYYQCNVDSLAQLSVKKHDTVKNVTKTTNKSTKKTKIQKSSLSFEGFRISSGVDRFLQKNFCRALDSYTGPGGVLITSMRRKYCTHSRHRTGDAIDINMDATGRKMLLWLISDDGTRWLMEHDLSFYIEDKPNSKRLDEFKRDANYQYYVFENKHATGLHIHMYKQ